MKNIYIIGEAKGSYRTQNLVKVLLDQNYKIHYSNIEYSFYPNSKSLINRVKRKISVILIKLITLPSKIILIYYSDIVILSAMNNNKQLEFNLARYFKKKIITDYYVSEFDSKVNDRTTVAVGSKTAMKLRENEINIISNSTKVLYLNSTEAKRYSELVGIPISKINFEIVPLCIEDREKAKLPFFNKAHDFISVCWWGTYIPLHGLEKIIEAGALLKEKNVKFKISLFGDSEKKSLIYQKMINEKILNDYITIYNEYTFQNGNLEGFLVKNCDIVLGNFGDSDKSKNVLVNKLVDGVALNIPVLTGESIAPKEFFNGDDDIFYTSNNPESIASSILKISNLKHIDILKRTEKAFSIYVNNFSVNSFRKKIIMIIETM